MITRRSTPKPTRNQLIVAVLRQAEDFRQLATDSSGYQFQTRKVMRDAAGMLHAAVELYRNGTWDRPTIEAWHDAATITLAQFKAAAIDG